MIIVNGVDSFRKDHKPLVLALGNFDGVHIGHQYLVRQANQEAKDLDGTSAMMVFDPHPLKVLVPARAPKLLTTLRQKTRILDDLGLNALIVTPFTREIAAWSPEKFVDQILVKILGVKSIYVGYNYSFGSKASGNAEMLQSLGRENDINVHIINPIKVDDQVVSSTLVRKCLEEGDIEAVYRLTGRYPVLEGMIIEGERRGRTIGYPTANLLMDPELVTPGLGVYAVRAMVNGIFLDGVANIGKKPTFHEDYPISIETHLFDFDRDIYGEKISIALVQRIRGEKKFGGTDELIKQIQDDSGAAREILKNNSNAIDIILKSWEYQ